MPEPVMSLENAHGKVVPRQEGQALPTTFYPRAGQVTAGGSVGASSNRDGGRGGSGHVSNNSLGSLETLRNRATPRGGQTSAIPAARVGARSSAPRIVVPRVATLQGRAGQQEPSPKGSKGKERAAEAPTLESAMPSEEPERVLNAIESTAVQADSPQSETPQCSNEYDVEAIVADKLEGNTIFFLVKWKGYGESENTWEPAEHLHPDTLAAYNDEYVPQDTAATRPPRFQPDADDMMITREGSSSGDEVVVATTAGFGRSASKRTRASVDKAPSKRIVNRSYANISVGEREMRDDIISQIQDNWQNASSLWPKGVVVPVAQPQDTSSVLLRAIRDLSAATINEHAVAFKAMASAVKKRTKKQGPVGSQHKLRVEDVENANKVCIARQQAATRRADKQTMRSVKTPSKPQPRASVYPSGSSAVASSLFLRASPSPSAIGRVSLGGESSPHSDGVEGGNDAIAGGSDAVMAILQLLRNGELNATISFSPTNACR